ncbi:MULTISPECIES: PPE family protein [unclassified Mycobacterium]|uniref:PPE family protein n=1 Tax=unclassified Mycobacterium TaxID=2642494 RepID=UPI000FAD3307|nr:MULTISPECIES: PPE family protein [unclassified Mycobacterium]MDP7701761.1 PPE family protein [Mycobacterium sp. TY815]MDP7724596.1 PPE family protein [Mycobacterium sp. TY814]RUP01282.1 MAG: PPE family protein [Mycobacterium sp.]
MVDYGILPPEVNSGRIYTGPGAGPMLAAAAAWSGLAADLQAAASGHRLVIAELTSGPWLGPSSAAMLTAATPFVAFLDSSAAEAEQAASQAFAAAAAYEAAFAASIPPPVIAANRALLAVLVATNFLGQNTPAIAATEALYAEFWAQDAAAMYNYAGSAAAATQFGELPEPAEVADPYQLVDQAIAAFEGQYNNVFSNMMNVGSQLNPRVADVLKTLSTPINSTAIDQWLIANTPLDDIVPLYSKYLSPYVSTITAVFQSGQAFGQASSGSIAITNFMNNLAPAAKAVEGAAQAAGAAGANLGTKVGSVTAGLGRAVPLSGLSVPASWTQSVGAATGQGATAIGNATAIPAAAEGAVAAGNTPVAPPFGQFFNAGSGRKTPAYGHRLTFMTRPPAAG